MEKPMTTEHPTLEQFDAFVKRLSLHDWHYDYSDDYSVYRAGKTRFEGIARDAGVHPMYRQAYDAWHTYVYGSKGTADARTQRDQRINEIRAELLITA
jgi:hypothetical protein